MRDSVVFYRSFMSATDDLTPKQYKNLVKSILHYAMDDLDPDLKGVEKTLFDLIKPQIDANNKRFFNGCKGGRPKNQTITKGKPNNNQNETKPKPNVNVNDNVNVNENEDVVTTASALYQTLCKKYGKDFVDERVERGKKYKSTNMQTIARWCEEDKKSKSSFGNERVLDFDSIEKKLLERRC